MRRMKHFFYRINPQISKAKNKKKCSTQKQRKEFQWKISSHFMKKGVFWDLVDNVDELPQRTDQ